MQNHWLFSSNNISISAKKLMRKKKSKEDKVNFGRIEFGSSPFASKMRFQHRLCPSRFLLPFFASSRPTKRWILIPPAWCKRYWQTSLKMNLIENTLYCFRTNGNIPEMRTWNPQWNAEGQNRATTWKMSARGFSSLGLFAWSKWYIMLRNHLCSLCYWNSMFYMICNLQIWILSS